MKTTLKFAAAAAALAGTIGSAQALEVQPGTGPISGPPTVSALGTLLDSIATTITTPTFTGIARSAVYDGPEAGVNLNFFYQFSNTSGTGALDAIGRMSAGGFGSFTTDVFQSAGGFGSFVTGTVGPATVDRSTGGTLGFNFVPTGVGAGESTNVVEIHTNAIAFASNWMGVLNSTGGFAPAFAPTGAAPIPEPETYALMLAGLGLLGFIGKRRMRNGGPADGAADPAHA